MNFIDIHSHLDHPLLFDKLDEIISRAISAGVRHVITNGINPKTNRMCLEISKKYEIVKCGMGIYPRDSLKKESSEGNYKIDVSDFDIDDEINFIRCNKDKIAAISEVGLDFVHGESKEQISDFEKMISLSKELGLAIVIHSRKAEQRCIEFLEANGARKVIMHCFCGKKSLVKRIADNGWFLTIPTIAVRSYQFQDIAKSVPLAQLFCETDSPYLSPYKEMQNEPSFVVESYRKIAQIKGMELKDVADEIYKNWEKVFGASKK